MKCWGYGESGRLGQNSGSNWGHTTALAGSMRSLPSIAFSGNLKVKSMASGWAHTCATLEDNSLRCLGNNLNGEEAIQGRDLRKSCDIDVLFCLTGQLGVGNTTSLGATAGSMSALAAINVGAGRTVVQVSAGESFTCALLDDGSLKCFGRNDFGQLGQDNTTIIGRTSASEVAKLAPINLGTDRTVKQVACGSFHSCAILDNDQLKCWGYNVYGALGRGNTTNAGDAATRARSMTNLATVNLGTGRGPPNRLPPVAITPA